MTMVAQLAPGPDLSGHKRLVADRFRRVWYIVEDIAANPGQSRLELAEKYHLSERQVQADLNIIRSDMRLPLVRLQGYRFSQPGERNGPTHLALTDALTVLAVITQARTSRSRLTVHLDALAGRLPLMFPIHLQPLVAFALRSPVGATLVGAILNGETVRLHYRPGYAHRLGPTTFETIKPTLLLPFLDSWYVIGESEAKSRHGMRPLDAVVSVTVAP